MGICLTSSKTTAGGNKTTETKKISPLEGLRENDRQFKNALQAAKDNYRRHREI